MYTEQEIEFLEDISQQLKSILAKFTKMHWENRKKPSKSDSKSKITKTSPGEDLSDQTFSKMRFETCLSGYTVCIIHRGTHITVL